jgi:hypothetical protein
VAKVAKRLAKRVQELAKRIEEMERLEELPGNQVEAWARVFAELDDRDVTEDDLDFARDFVVYCLDRGKEPTWVELMLLANSAEAEEEE